MDVYSTSYVVNVASCDYFDDQRNNQTSHLMMYVRCCMYWCIM